MKKIAKFLTLFFIINFLTFKAYSDELVSYTMTQIRVFAFEDDTNVTITNLTDGSIYATFNIPTAGSDWSRYPGVPNYISIDSDKPVNVFVGKAHPGRNDWAALIPSTNYTKFGTEFYGFTEYHLWIFVPKNLLQPPTEITVTDLSDGDDTTTLTVTNAELITSDVEIYHLTDFEYDNIHVVSNLDCVVLAGSSSIMNTDGWAYTPPSVAPGEDGRELGTHFFAYVKSKMAIYAFSDNTNVIITDLSDSDDSKYITLNSGWIYSVENPPYKRNGVHWLSNNGNLFDTDYVEVVSNNPIIFYVGPTYNPGGRFILDFAPAVATGPQSRIIMCYANMLGVEILTFDNTTNVSITSLSSSNGTYHDYTISQSDWQGVGPYYWQAPTYFNQELLRIESDKPISVFYGDFYSG